MTVERIVVGGLGRLPQFAHAGVVDCLVFVSGSLGTTEGTGRDRDPTVHVARSGREVEDPCGRIQRLAHLDSLDVFEHHGMPIARPERVILGLAAIETRAWRPSRFRHRRDLSEVDVLRPVLARMGPVIDLGDKSWLLTNKASSAESATTQRPSRSSSRSTASGSTRRRPIAPTTTDGTNDCSQMVVRLLIWEYDLWHRAKEVREALANRFRHPDVAPTLHRLTLAPWELLPAAQPGPSPTN